MCLHYKAPDYFLQLHLRWPRFVKVIAMTGRSHGGEERIVLRYIRLVRKQKRKSFKTQFIRMRIHFIDEEIDMKQPIAELIG